MKLTVTLQTEDKDGHEVELTVLTLAQGDEVLPALWELERMLPEKPQTAMELAQLGLTRQTQLQGQFQQATQTNQQDAGSILGGLFGGR